MPMHTYISLVYYMKKYIISNCDFLFIICCMLELVDAYTTFVADLLSIYKKLADTKYLHRFYITRCEMMHSGVEQMIVRMFFMKAQHIDKKREQRAAG